MKLKKIKNCPICKFNKFDLIYKYNKKPKIETNFGIENYNRSYFECQNCNHWVSNFVISDKFYKDFYVNKTYNKNYLSKFEKIIKLKKKSDNFFRSNRVDNFLKKSKIKNIKILDVGSGLGVFPYEMKKRGYDICALDPDKKMSEFIKKKLNIFCYHADFQNFKSLKKFNFITLNKVLEHVEDPLAFIKKIKRKLLNKNSAIYIEVPDTNAARMISKNREEFCIEHINCFSKKSLKLMLEICGFKIITLRNIKEASGKLTTYVFAKLF